MPFLGFRDRSATTIGSSPLIEVATARQVAECIRKRLHSFGQTCGVLKSKFVFLDGDQVLFPFRCHVSRNRIFLPPKDPNSHHPAMSTNSSATRRMHHAAIFRSCSIDRRVGRVPTFEELKLSVQEAVAHRGAGLAALAKLFRLGTESVGMRLSMVGVIRLLGELADDLVERSITSTLSVCVFICLSLFV